MDTGLPEQFKDFAAQEQARVNATKERIRRQLEIEMVFSDDPRIPASQQKFLDDLAEIRTYEQESDTLNATGLRFVFLNKIVIDLNTDRIKRWSINC